MLSMRENTGLAEGLDDGGGITLGLATLAMHFIGMLAFHGAMCLHTPFRTTLFPAFRRLHESRRIQTCSNLPTPLDPAVAIP